MEFKGTKGKWLVDIGVGVTSINSKRFPAGIDSIATIKNQFHNYETKANAILISKAPEMLEMLKQIDDALDQLWQKDDKNILFDYLNGIDTKQLIKSATEL